MTETTLSDSWPLCKPVASVTVYPRGCLMTAKAGQFVRKKWGSGGIRGTVKGFSYASRRRMRHFLMTMDLPGRFLYNVTFTLPTTDIDDEQERAIFARWSSDAVHAGWSAVWRLQVQRRGARHWHLLIGIEPHKIGARLRDPERFDSQDYPERLRWQLGQLDIEESWAAACDSIGEVGIKIGHDAAGLDVMGRGLVHKAVGFSRHAVDVQGEHDHRPDEERDRAGNYGGAWCRYLCDHSTRSAQEAVGKGRQWGIIGRKGFVQIVPDERVKMTDGQYARFRRAYERLATASRKAPQSVFGSKLGRRVKRGRRGTAASFVRPETVRRLVAWAIG